MQQKKIRINEGHTSLCSQMNGLEKQCQQLTKNRIALNMYEVKVAMRRLKIQ